MVKIRSKFLPLAIAAALCAGTLHAAERTVLLPPAAGDLVATRLVTAKSALAADVERAPVDFAWALDPDAALQSQAPFVAQSREFWTRVDAGTLQKGYTFHTTAPGAFVRLSPAEGVRKSAALRVDDLALRLDGRVLDASAIRVSANAEQLKSTGAQFGDGTLVFRLDETIGTGRMELTAKSARGDYLVHVFEPDSPYTLSLGADRDRALAGDTVRLSAHFDGAKGRLTADSIGGLVTSPDERSLDVTFTRAKEGSYTADVALPQDAAGGLALWEVHAFAAAKHGNASVLRDAKTSFAVSAPTARLLGTASSEAKRDGISIAVAVDTASAGRYEVRGVLYGSAKDGAMRPLAVAHAARWLEPGASDVTLKFGADVLHPALGAPYELRDLQLGDQARLGILETRARAMRIAR